MRITLGNSSLVSYQQGGGLWSWFLQYPLALKALGHDVLWLELMQSTGIRDHDTRLVRDFFTRLAIYGLERNCALLMFAEKLDTQPFEKSEALGRDQGEVREFIRSSDLLLNFCCAIRQPMLSMFPYRALLDCDPGHLQVSALTWDLNIPDHNVWLTLGGRINAPGCEVPKLGVEWRTFESCVYLPMWQAASDPGVRAPITSITQWTWEELPWKGGLVSVSKRAAYLKYRELPQLAGRPFELAANIGANDPVGDREQMRQCGWGLVEPHDVAATPAQYQEYIRGSRAEFMCPKPIHVTMRTGWFSERSIAYLASGRPVLAEETGFGERIPTGAGLIAFRNVDEALMGIAEIDGNYERHRRAARELAESIFDSRKCVTEMLSACEA